MQTEYRHGFRRSSTRQRSSRTSAFSRWSTRTTRTSTSTANPSSTSSTRSGSTWCSHLSKGVGQRQQEEAARLMVHPMIQAAAVVQKQMVNPVKVVIRTQTSGNTPPQQTGGAGPPGGSPQSPPGISQPNRHPDPWASLDRSRKPLPKLMLPSNYKACSILDMRQILES